MKEYKEFTISFQPFNSDLISGLLWNFQIEGIVEENSFLKVFSLKEKNYSESDFEKILFLARKENLIESFFVSAEDVENKNWNEEWEKKIQVIKVTDKIVIKPSFREYKANEGEIVITIDPKMSFGTGEHETTKLILGFLENYISCGAKVLDVGSGTAILSIASAKLGAQSVIAIDNDELCLENGLENVAVNNVENVVRVYHKEIKDIEEINFDIILANINRHILIDIAEEIKKKIKSQGTLILSGLLITDEKEIISIYNSLGFEYLHSKHLNEWTALIFKAKF